MRIPGTSERVPQHTPRYVNERIERMTLWNLEYYAAHPDQIDQRLYELDREWDVERTLETNAASVSLLGIILGATVSKRWFVLPGIVGGFLLQHALQGWCPPVSWFRRLGVRTQSEIDQERYALKVLRGDFNDLRHDGAPGRSILEAIRRKFRQYGIQREEPAKEPFNQPFKEAFQQVKEPFPQEPPMPS